MEGDDDHSRLRPHQVDFALELGPVDVGADAIEAEKGELHAANVADLVEAES